MTIPVGFSAVTYRIVTPAPGGSHISTLNHGIHATPSDALAIALDGHFATFWDTVGFSESIYLGVEVRDSIRAHEASTPTPGGNGGSIPPPQVCALVRKRTGLIGRTERGRFYFPAVLKVDDVADDGTIKSTPFANLNTDIEDWRLAMDTDPDAGTMVVLHTTGEEAPTPVIELQLQHPVATQRRRLR